MVEHAAKPMSEIAYECGFADAWHLSRETRHFAMGNPFWYRNDLCLRPPGVRRQIAIDSQRESRPHRPENSPQALAQPSDWLSSGRNLLRKLAMTWPARSTPTPRSSKGQCYSRC